MSEQKKLPDIELGKIRQAKRALRAFDWQMTSEGHPYWYSVWQKLHDKVKHGTNDGKPYIKPERWRVPTDEDAKSRPKCRVKDHATSDWQEAILVHVDESGDASYPFSVAMPNKAANAFSLCEISDTEN